MDDSTHIAHGPDLLGLQHMLKALADRVRLEMVAVLAGGGEVTVTDLGATLAANGHLVSQPLVSWHISVLRRRGLVRTRRFGRQVYCSLDRARYDWCLAALGALVRPGDAQAAGAPDATGMLGRSH
jgi:ArsR family transcriptional regulator